MRNAESRTRRMKNIRRIPEARAESYGGIHRNFQVFLSVSDDHPSRKYREDIPWDMVERLVAH